MKIKIFVHNGLVGCTKTDIIEVDDDLTDEQIDQECQEHVLSNMIEFGWDRI
jgi:hypothetical protein